MLGIVDKDGLNMSWSLPSGCVGLVVHVFKPQLSAQALRGPLFSFLVMFLLFPFAACVSQGSPGKQTYLGCLTFLETLPVASVTFSPPIELCFATLLTTLSFLCRCFGGSSLQKVVFPKVLLLSALLSLYTSGF